MDPVPFEWLSRDGYVTIIRKGQVCGMVSTDVSNETPPSLHMEFPCPYCNEKECLGVYPTAPEAFVASVEYFNDLEQPIDHEDYAIKHKLMELPPHKALKEIPFTFVHKCFSCNSYFNTKIKWNEECKAFELRLFKCVNEILSKDFTDIFKVQRWEFTGPARPYLNEESGFSDVKYSRGYSENWQYRSFAEEWDYLGRH